MRDKNTKEAFIKFLQDPKNKDLRFWQAIRNFSKYEFVLGWEGDFFDLGSLPIGIVETFHIEADEEMKHE